jgi:hypothetical protein
MAFAAIDEFSLPWQNSHRFQAGQGWVTAQFSLTGFLQSKLRYWV